MTESKSNLVVVRKESNIGRITLNRPSSLNALTAEMTQEITKALIDWAQDSSISFIIIDSSSQNSFSSGGDLKAVYQNSQTFSNIKDHAESILPFFAAQYKLNYLISTYKKPIVSLVSGICMGAGLGLAIYCPYRVITDECIMAMPETSIGFFPDVGAAYFLQSHAQTLGMILGLSGWRFTPSQAIWLGLGTHYVESNLWKDFTGDLLKTSSLESTLEKYSSSPPEDKELKPYSDKIQQCFISDKLSVSMEVLEMSNIPICQEIYKKIIQSSPTSLLVWQYYTKQSYGLPLKEILRSDYRLAQNFLLNHDFYEGIRAKLIDKDQTPHWRPNVLDAVDEEKVKQYYSSTPFNELEL